MFYLCEDLDECSSRMNNCSQHATCTNEVAGFSCSCNSGFNGTGVFCEGMTTRSYKVGKKALTKIFKKIPFSSGSPIVYSKIYFIIG